MAASPKAAKVLGRAAGPAYDVGCGTLLTNDTYENTEDSFKQ